MQFKLLVCGNQRLVIQTFSRIIRRVIHVSAKSQTSKRCLSVISSASTLSQAKFPTYSSCKLNDRWHLRCRASWVKTLKSIPRTCKNLKRVSPKRSIFSAALTSNPRHLWCSSTKWIRMVVLVEISAPLPTTRFVPSIEPNWQETRLRTQDT